jgi:hypothetical protein
LKEIIDEQTNTEKTVKQHQETVGNLQNELIVKNQMIEKYKAQLL